MFLPFGFVLHVLVSHAVCVICTRLIAKFYPILVYAVSWMVQADPSPKPDSSPVPAAEQKVSYASFFSCAQHEGIFSCARIKEKGERCGWAIGKTRQRWARDVYRTFSTLPRADEDLKTFLMEYAESSLCIRHAEDRETLQKLWLAELESAYRVYLVLTTILPSYFRPEQCMKGSNSSNASECGDSNCLLHLDHYTAPRTLFAVNVYYDAVGCGRLQVHGPLSDIEWDPDIDITPALRARRLTGAHGNAAVQLFRSVHPQNLNVLLDYLRTPLQGDDLKEGHLYAYIYPSNPEYVKIGWTGSVHERMDQWSECGHDLQLVGYTKERIPFARRTEQLIHRYLQQRGLRRHFMGCASKGSRNRKCSAKHIEWFEISTQKAMLAVERWICWITTAQAYDQAGKLTDEFVRVLAQAVPAEEEDEATWRFDRILNMTTTPSGDGLWYRVPIATLSEPVAHSDQVVAEDVQPDNNSTYDLDNELAELKPLGPNIMSCTTHGYPESIATEAVQHDDNAAEAEPLSPAPSLPLRPASTKASATDAPWTQTNETSPPQSPPQAPRTPLRKFRPSIISSHNKTPGDSPASSSSSISTLGSIFSAASASSAASSATELSDPPTPTPSPSSGREGSRRKSKPAARGANKSGLSSSRSPRRGDKDANEDVNTSYTLVHTDARFSLTSP